MTGRILLVGRLAVRDLRRRRTEVALLLLAVLAATTTLTLGLVLRDAASDPYQDTRAATQGPDVLAFAPVDLVPSAADRLAELAGAAGVTDHSGPFPVTAAKLQTIGGISDVQVVGRDAASASVDQPELIRGGWVHDGGVVVEAAFAAALDLRVGDPVRLEDRSFTVAGIAVTSAMPPYPGHSCVVGVGCARGAITDDMGLPPELLRDPGLVWLTRADLWSLGSDRTALSYMVNLKLADPDQAQAFADDTMDTLELRSGPPLGMLTWQEIQDEATELARDSQILLMTGAWLLGLLAVATLSVLVGGRMADQSRRVGLLKAVGGTPGLAAAVLLAAYLLVAMVAAAVGLAIGTLTAPLLTESSAGLIGSAGTPPVTVSTIALVLGAALLVAVVATAVPAVRAARTSTVDALADVPRPPRRTGWLIAVSARLPVPLLLALRVAARRPRRIVLAVAIIAITISGIYVLLVLNAFLGSQPVGGYSDAQVGLLRRVLFVWMVILLALTAVNAIVITWASVLDNRRASALARALGATPRQVSVALAAAQVLPALAGAVLGAFPGGFALFAVLMALTGGDGDRATLPSAGQLLALVLLTGLAVAVLTAIPARVAGRRPVTESL